MGSRASGLARPQSDWDFKIATTAFPEIRDAMPQLVVPLHPVIAPVGPAEPHLVLHAHPGWPGESGPDLQPAARAAAALAGDSRDIALDRRSFLGLDAVAVLQARS